MSTILIYTSPARGHLYPIMDIALALRAAGHRVLVQTLADERDNVVAEGLEHRAISAKIEAIPLEDFKGSNPVAQFRNAFKCWLARAEHELDDLRVATDELSIDLLLVDANTWGAAAFAEGLGRPWAMFMPYCLPLPSPETPAFGPGFAPPKSAFDRVRDRIVWGATNLGMRKQVAELDKLRARAGAQPVGRHSGIFLRADALLYLTAEPFDYPRSHWPANVHAIGPGLWAPKGEVPAWLEELPRPRTLVGVSTELQNDGAIIEAALAALADEPGSVIVTTAALDPETFTAPHDRVRITRFLPHAEVLPYIDLVVTHGGMGTTQRALAAGTPICVVPWGRDQNESARRTEVCGAGTMVPRAKLNAANLRAAVKRARECGDGAQRVAAGFKAAGGAKRAVGILEELLH